MKVVLCSGKIAFDLDLHLQDDVSGSVRVVRLEELSPFPVNEVKAAIEGATSVTWVQEECMNQGAFQFAKLHVDKMLAASGKRLTYIGRPSLHSFCTGCPVEHKAQGE